jgi:YggT family protein
VWILQILSGLIIVYLLLLVMRIVLGWFAPQSLGKAWDLLLSATDPYLGLFRRVKFLRAGAFDFSPVAALLAIAVVLDLLYQVIYWGQIRLGVFLSSVLHAAWFGVRFFLVVFLIVGILRALPRLFRGSSGAALVKVLDTVIQPVVAWVTRVFRLGLRAPYPQQLLFTLGVLFVALVLAEIGVRALAPLLAQLPF